MSSERFSAILWCWHDSRTDSVQLRVIRTDTAEEVPFKDGKFLLRIWSDDSGRVERCLIRHLASKREAYIQGGSKLRDFVKACLLDDKTQPPAGTTGAADETDT